jgi:uncharacterized phage protein (TIGR02218 family)
MKAAGAAFIAAVALETTYLSRLWTVERSDGTTLRFTDHDTDLTFGGDVYAARTGFQASAIVTTLSAAAQGVSIEFLLNVSGFDEDAIRAGLYDGQTCTLLILERTSAEVMTAFKGTLGEVSITDHGYARAEIEGIVQSGKIITEQFSLNCRADLGDARCKVDIDALKVAFTVASAVASNDGFSSADLTQADSQWDLGLVVWVTGSNAGDAIEVAKSLATGDVTLFMPARYAIEAGDTGLIYPGCTKFPSMCIGRYANFDNYRGEPFAPKPAAV